MCRIPKPEEIDLVVYHASCSDGFTAAWAAWERVGNRAEYVACQYQDDPPDVKGKNVAILDLCFPRKLLEKMTKEAKSLVVLDHHRTAQEDLGASVRKIVTIGDQEFDVKADRDSFMKALKTATPGSLTIEEKEIPPFPNAIFDMTKSGALIAWEWFHPGFEVPKLVQHVSDRDLWKFELEGTRLVHAALGLLDFDFEEWKKAALALEKQPNLEKFMQRGDFALEQINKDCESIAKKAQIIEFEGVKMWTTNYAGRYNSDVAQMLRDRETEDGEVPGVSLTWFYQQSKNTFRCSLRSRDDRADVSAIAKKYGGGGHRNAAGFEWPDDIRLLVKSS